jgi:hypothetical protein
MGLILAALSLGADLKLARPSLLRQDADTDSKSSLITVNTHGIPCALLPATLRSAALECTESVSSGAISRPQPSTIDRSSARSTSSSAAAPDWQLLPRHEPIRRVAPQVAYDAAHGTVVLFGGYICQGASCFPTDDTWTFDGSSWTQRHPATSPSARYLGSMTFDAKRGRVLLFGGLACTDSDCTTTAAASDTWTWDGTNWVQQSSTLAPSARYGAATTFDSDNERVLLYGGCIGSCPTEGADLWAWDGAQWSLIDINSAPGARFCAQFAYDPAHKKTVLFSGSLPQSSNQTGVADPSDTWTFDGSTWTQQSPAHNPKGRWAGGMIWDANRQRIVLFGGFADEEPLYKNAYRQDVWIWDGTDWTEQANTTQPLRSYEIGFVYNELLGKAVFIGGDSFIIPDYLAQYDAGFTVFERATWTLDAAGWTRLPSAEPNDRSGANMAYYPPNETVLLYGGYCLDQPDTACHDTWVWSVDHWTELHLPFNLSASAGLTYDAIDRVLVAPFGSRTYTWDGTEWTRHDNTADPEMFTVLSAVTQDATGRPVYFGGVTGASTYHNDIFRWDGTRWNKLQPSVKPPGRELMQAVYDEARRQLVIYGGIGCGPATPLNNCPLDYLKDTWTWDGNTWTQQNPAQNPGQRAFGMMAFDSGTQMSILHSGVVTDSLSDTLVDDTWTWDGANWAQLSPANSPGPLISFMMTRYPTAAKVFVFGGQKNNPGRIVSNTWTFGISPTPLQLVSVVSRKTHGSAGFFDVDLANDNGAIECRSGGANGEYTLVFRFTNALTNVGSAMITNGNGTVSSRNIDGNDARQYIVNVSGVNSGQAITVTLTNVADNAGNSIASVPTTMSVLVGDTSRDGVVNSADIAQTKSQSGIATGSSNFREDVNADGVINSADIAFVKSRSGSALP